MRAASPPLASRMLQQELETASCGCPEPGGAEARAHDTPRWLWARAAPRGTHIQQSFPFLLQFLGLSRHMLGSAGRSEPVFYSYSRRRTRGRLYRSLGRPGKALRIKTASKPLPRNRGLTETTAANSERGEWYTTLVASAGGLRARASRLVARGVEVDALGVEQREALLLAAGLGRRDLDDRVERDRDIDALLAREAHQVGVQHAVDRLVADDE